MQLCNMQLCVLLLVACRTFASCVYVKLGGAESRCFLLNTAGDVTVVGNYKAQVNGGHLSAQQSLGMFVEVKDPDKKVILSHQYSSEGSFTFTSHTPGQHDICLQCNSSSFQLSEAMLVQLDIQIEKKIPFRAKLTELQSRVQMLTQQVYKIQQEEDHQKYREQYFRQISESTIRKVNSSIFYTLIGLVALAFWGTIEFKSK